jgi:hypothetical protein
MRFQIVGKLLTKRDKKVLRQFCHYATKMIKTKKSPALIRIYFINEKNLKSNKDRQELKHYLAWINMFGSGNFTVIINENMINRNVKDPLKRLRNAMMCVGHELVHVKQYINHEMRDYVNGDVWFKGQRYTKWEEAEDYYFSPWEIEAYGHEEGLFECFKDWFSTK